MLIANKTCYDLIIVTGISRMTINLTPEQERIINDELKSGHFRSAEEVIAEALFALRERKDTSSSANDNGRAVREMLNFVDKNRTPLQGVSVKELIHEGHHL